MKRLIIFGLVVALVTVMSAPAVLFATGGGGNNDGHGKGKGHCKNIDKPGHKKHHKHHKHHKKCKKKNDCDDNHNGIITASEKEYCDDDNGNGHNGNGHNGNHNGNGHNGGHNGNGHNGGHNGNGGKK